MLNTLLVRAIFRPNIVEKPREIYHLPHCYLCAMYLLIVYNKTMETLTEGYSSTGEVRGNYPPAIPIGVLLHL